MGYIDGCIGVGLLGYCKGAVMVGIAILRLLFVFMVMVGVAVSIHAFMIQLHNPWQILIGFGFWFVGLLSIMGTISKRVCWVVYGWLTLGLIGLGWV